MLRPIEAKLLILYCIMSFDVLPNFTSNHFTLVNNRFALLESEYNKPVDDYHTDRLIDKYAAYYEYPDLFEIGVEYDRFGNRWYTGKEDK